MPADGEGAPDPQHAADMARTRYGDALVTNVHLSGDCGLERRESGEG